MTVAHQRPKVAELADFVRPRGIRGTTRNERRLADVRTTADFERLAARRTPRAVMDYVRGAAERESSMRRSTEAFDAVTFRPRVLRDVTTVDPTTTILGNQVAFPVVLGPTGFTRMMRTEGEPAVARAAARAGVPYALSTMGTTSPEDLSRTGGDGEQWFQLYLWRDRERSTELLDRVAASGFRTLVLTVDVPVAGARQRDVRNGLTIPPSVGLRTMADMARHPRWVYDFVRGESLTFGGLEPGTTLEQGINRVFDPAATLADVEWLRSRWDGNLVVKGVMRVDDAKDIASVGVDALVVSNHGGRQLDRSATPLDLLPEVATAVGDTVEVYLDGGVRCGADVAAAVSLGARAAFIARPYLYALMAGGEAGVDHLLGMLHTDYLRTLQLLGVTATDQLGPDCLDR